jgi:DNA-binding ferritin-like protein (Dps family)
MGDEGNLGWKAALEPDLQKHEDLADVAEVKTLARSYVDLKGKAKNALFIPGADAKDEDKAAFNQKINEVRGVPAKPEEYELPFDKKAKDYNAEMDSAVRNMFHKAGVDKNQAQALLKEFTEIDKKFGGANMDKVRQTVAQEISDLIKADSEKVMADAATALKTEWADKYDANIALAMKAADNMEKVVPGFKQFAIDSGLGNNPFLLKAFAFVGSAISEGSFVGGTREGNEGGEGGFFDYPSMDKKQ